MKIKKITDRSVFDTYVKNHPYCHYMKTSMWGEFKKKTEKNYSYEMLGFYEENELCGTAMVLRSSWLTHRFMYIPKGPCIDYEDQSVLNQVFTLLQQYADEQKVHFLRVDPNVVRVPHDIKGNALDGFNHEYVTDELKSIGYTHKGYGYAYDGSWSNRYTLIVDLSKDMDSVVKNYTKKRQQTLRKGKLFHIETRIGGKKDIPILMEYEMHLCWQDAFEPHSYSFFEDILDTFGENAVMYVTEVHLDEMIEDISKEITKKAYQKDPEAKQAKEKEIVHAKELMARYGNVVPIAAGLFVRFGNTSWDLYTYSHKEFTAYSAVDNLHRFVMEDMKNHGVIHYDMVGFSGVTTPDDPEYGLYLYKSSFGPEYIEQIGEFDYVRNAKKMKRFRFEKLAINHMKRKGWKKYGKENPAESDYEELHRTFLNTYSKNG